MNLETQTVPTERPRLTITLTDRTHRALTAASRVMKKSRGAMVLELIDNVTPMLEQLATAAQALSRATPEARAHAIKNAPHFLAAMEAIGQSAAGAESAVLASLDLFAGLPVASDAPAREARSGGRVGASRPPPVNKGVTTTTRDKTASRGTTAGGGAGKGGNVVKLRRGKA